MTAPSVTSLLKQGLRYFYGEQQSRDESGGLNLRDAASELAANESPDMWNVTLDERGGISKRLGYAKNNPTPFNASKVSNVFYWPTGTNKITQSGTKLYKDDSLTEFKTFTTTERCGFADFTGLLFFIHPTDGLFKYDGTTVTAIAAGPKGTTLAPWQNKLWASGDPTAKARVYFSNAGDGTLWGGTAFNDLREKDSEPVVCLAGAAGLDVAGRPGLLAFKRRSSYRIYDSATGAYQTIDPQVGAASALAVTNLFERTIALSEQGIFWTDGVGPMRPASDKINPLFTPAYADFSTVDKWCAGARGDRCYFSLQRVGGSVNDLMLEYHPLQGWITANSNAASCYATYGLNTQKLLSGSPSVNGQVYEQLTGGADDAAAITSRFQTKWLELTNGHDFRITRLRVSGRGNFSVNPIRNYELAPFTALSANLSGAAAVYDDAGAVYDRDGVLYGPTSYQQTVDFPQLGVMKAVSLQFSETSTGVSSGLQILGSGTAPQIGAWGVYGVDYSYVPLGFS